MTEDTWLPLNQDEKALLVHALRSSRASNLAGSDEIDALVLKLAQSNSYPQITVEVERGLVQALGNPFPIHVRDYDIEGGENLDIDEHGKRCRMWFEPADPQACRNYRDRKS